MRASTEIFVDPSMLTTAQVFAQRLGWDTIEFETPDDAIKFVQEKISEGVVPHKPKRET